MTTKRSRCNISEPLNLGDNGESNLSSVLHPFGFGSEELTETILLFAVPSLWHRLQQCCRAMQLSLDAEFLARLAKSAKAKVRIEDCDDGPDWDNNLWPIDALNCWKLLAAALAGDVEDSAILLSQMGTPAFVLDAMDSRFGGLLHRAALGGSASVTRLLLSSFHLSAQHLDKVNTHGETPVFVASLAGQSKALEALLGARADVNASAYGCSPLLVASHFGDFEVLNCLLTHSADVNFQSRSDGVTPLIAHSWSPLEKTYILEALLAARADVSLTTSNGSTALDYALSEQNAGSSLTPIVPPVTSMLPRRPFRQLARERYADILQAAGAQHGVFHDGYRLFGIPPPVHPSVCIRRSDFSRQRRHMLGV